MNNSKTHRSEKNTPSFENVEMLPKEIQPNEITKSTEQECLLLPFLGIFLTLFAGVFGNTASLLIKHLKPIDPMICDIGRSMVMLIIYTSLVVANKHSFSGIKNERWPNFGQAFLFAICSIAMCYALRLLPFGDAGAIFNASPAMVLILAYFLLDEEFGAFQLVALVLTLIGITMITKPSLIFGGFQSTSIEGQLLALLASATMSMVIIFRRKLQKTPTPVTLFWSGLLALASSSFIFCSTNYPFTHQMDLPVTLSDYFYISMIGVLYCLAVFLSLKSLQLEKAGVISLVRTTDIVYGYFIQTVFFNESLDILSIFGGIIIVASVVIISVKKLKDQQKLNANKV